MTTRMADASPSPESAQSPGSMLIDRVLPDYDAAIIEHLVVDAGGPATWTALKELDFLHVRTPLLVAAFCVRDLPAKIAHRLRGTPLPPPPPSFTLSAPSEVIGWVALGGEPEREIAVGAIGVFWTPEIEWEDVPAEEFAAFDRPGFGKVVADFTQRPYGEARTLLSYEARVLVTDPTSRRGFERYWVLVKPFVGHIMRATLRTVRVNGERPSPHMAARG